MAAFAGGVVGNVIVFCILMAWTLLVARVARGRGLAIDHVYVLALVWPVLNIVLGLPTLDALIWLPFAIWLPLTVVGIYLTTPGLQVVHGLQGRRLLLVALSPLILGLFCGGGALGIYAILALNPDLIS